MQLPDQNQVNAGLRHLYTVGGTVLGVAVALGALSADQSAAILTGIHDITDGLQQVVGGVWKISLVAGPVIAIYMGKRAFTSASPESQAKSLVSVANSTSPKAEQATVAILNAVTKLDNVNVPKGAIEAPAAVANAVPSEAVVPKS